MVPRCETRSSSFMPMPVSAIGEGLVLFVEFQVDARIERERLVCVIDERQMAELIQRVGGVGDQFAKKDLGMRIERVDDQLQQLVDFSLKFTFRHKPKLQSVSGEWNCQSTTPRRRCQSMCSHPARNRI
jgi:hypothetical protein